MNIVVTSAYFLGGPNHQTSADIQHEEGIVPEVIEIKGIEPSESKSGELVVKTGRYEESPFGGSVYLWRGWVEDVD